MQVGDSRRRASPGPPIPNVPHSFWAYSILARNRRRGRGGGSGPAFLGKELDADDLCCGLVGQDLAAATLMPARLR